MESIPMKLSFFVKLSVICLTLFLIFVNSKEIKNEVAKRSCACGWPVPIPRIFMGTKVQRHEFRWIAYIVIENWFGVQYCGGSVIDEKHVLTAAHCVGGQPPPVKVDVYLGHFNRKFMEQGLKGIHVEVEKIEVPPNYDPDDNLNNDIAILVLKEKIELTGAITPICLPNSNSKDLKRLTLAGWGKVGPNQGGSDVLLKVNLDYISNSRCEILSANHYYRQILKDMPEARNQYFRIPSRPFYKTHICALNLMSGGDACKGDSGSPLFVESPHNYKWYMVGLVSGGAPCGTTKKFPGWYTNVTYFSSWIQSIAKNARFCDFEE